MNITILKETENYLVINKPAGLVVHSDGKHTEPTVVDWVLEHYPEARDVGDKLRIEHQGTITEVPRSGIVHRIDRDTSGCLIIAKNQETFDFLKDQFKAHTIKKKYVAVVYGWPRDERGLIDQPIGRSSSNIRAWTTKSGSRGTRDAVTRFTVAKKFTITSPTDSELSTDQKYAIVDLYPQTGRTHQLRVHMSHMGHPIVADPIYAGKRHSDLPIHRTALHAERISFTSPEGKSIEVTAPLPEDLAAIIKK